MDTEISTHEKDPDMIRKKRISAGKIIKAAALTAAVIYFIIAPLAVITAHGIVMSKCTYDRYDSKRFLVYDDVAEKYPREKFTVSSGNNSLSAYIYGKDNTKGVIVVSPGHTDANDIKLYEIRYFVDAGYRVICFDYTGCYTSEGDSFGGYTQAVYDLDSILTFCDNNEQFDDLPVYLFGHSMGGYASAAVLNRSHRIEAAVSASGFDSAGEQWECSVKRFTGPAYCIIRPINLAFIHFRYGDDAALSAVDGINSSDIPVLVISADNDVFYGGGRSPIYEKRDLITNDRCEFILMDKPEHNEHYSYFLTDAAVEYQKIAPKENIDKELYMQHDTAVLDMICDFYERYPDKR